MLLKLNSSSKKNNFILIYIYTLLSYPLFYFSYKYCLPDLGGEDYYGYEHLYKNWDFAKAICPHNMRVISNFLIFLLNKIGLHYNTETVFTTVHPGFDQQVYFNATLFNFICVITTCFVIYKTVQLNWKNNFICFLSGSLYLLGFGTLFFSFKPISDSCGILLLSIAFYYYVQQKNIIHLVFLFCLFQREFVFITFGAIAFIEYIAFRKKYMIGVILGSALFLVVYIILRNTYFYTPEWAYQTSIFGFIEVMKDQQLNLFQLIKQTFFISNLFLLFLFVIGYKKCYSLSINRINFITVILLFTGTFLMGLISFGNNAGRYFYFTTPVLIFYLFIELKPVLSSYIKENV